MIGLIMYLGRYKLRGARSSTLLHSAAACGDLLVLQWILGQAALEKPLLVATANGHGYVANLLVANGADNHVRGVMFFLWYLIFECVLRERRNLRVAYMPNGSSNMKTKE